MERIKIKVNKRCQVGKEAAGRIRKEGSIPAVVYSSELNISISVPLESVKLLYSIRFSESAIVDMEIIGEEKFDVIPVLVKKLQFHPLTEKIIHIDFFKVSLKDKTRVNVHIVLKGIAQGLKEGGVLEQLLREVQVEGLPLDIPEKIELDITNLDIGHSFHVEDLIVPNTVKILTDSKTAIVAVVAIKEEVAEEIIGLEGEITEPQVLKEKKEA
ncbi:MAG: 50S ribosomal protein L25 [Candidatus Omnitrophica bacterium]|nr:50S ribosomal protein L25 [Candidatus Omnitrophota bacterium]